MRSKALDLLGGSNVDDNVAWSIEDTINYVPQKASSAGALTPHEFRDAPGLKPFVMGPTGAGPVRGSHDCEGKHFTVMGSTFYQITNAGIAIPLGTVPGTQRVNIAHNQIVGGNEVIITTGTPNGYVYNTVTLVFGRIIDPGYPGGGSVDYIDTYLVSVEPFGRYWFWSDQAAATSYNTLNRTEAEADPDSIVGLAVNSFEVVVFGQNTVEFFYNAGGINGSTFRSKKVMNNHGCAARDSIVKLDNSIFWLGVDGILYRLNGYQAQPISSPQFTQRIQGLNWAKAFAFAYEDQGHVIYYITFPDGQTWGYDVTTGLTVRRESYGLKRWRLNALTKIGRNWVGGDFQGPYLYTVDWNYPMEGEGTPLVRERYSGNVANDMNKIEVPLVELLFQTGSKEVAPVLFVEQPDPPTLTGEAPDNAVGQAYPGYTYGGTSPNGGFTITLRSGTLPPDVALSSAGELDDAVTTTEGEYTYTMRKTDVLGLFAEHTDTVLISAVWMMYATSGGGRLTQPSLGGADWEALASSQTIAAVTNPHWIKFGARTLMVDGSGTGATQYSDDDGSNWTAGPAIGAISGGGYQLLYVGDRLWVPRGTGGMAHSDDQGASYATQARVFNTIGGFTVDDYLIAGHAELLVRGGMGGGLAKSIDGGDSWVSAGIVSTATMHCGASDGSRILLGGLLSSAATIWRTLDGDTITACTVPSVANSQVSMIVSLGDGVWLAFISLDTGFGDTLWRSEDDGVTFEALDIGVQINFSTQNDIAAESAGRVTFIALESPGSTPGIYTTTDAGTTCTECPYDWDGVLFGALPVSIVAPTETAP